MSFRQRGTERSDAAILAALTIWAFAPLLVAILYVGRHGGVLTGANGTDFIDQFQYLSWIHDEGSHLLASNLWVTGGTPHDYLHPMYLISGLLWRLGASVQLAYLVWKPVALLVLFAGFCLYVRRLLPGRRGLQAAALVLALFYESPVLALASWTGQLSAAHRFQLTLATDDANSALNLWGFEHTAIAIGLMPVFLIAVEKLLAGEGAGGGGEGAGHRRTRTWVAVASGSGLLVSWLHPWQGAVLLAVVGAMFVIRPPRRRYLALAVPALATVLPLVYGLLLSRTDASWRAFQAQSTTTGTAPWWALLASFGPIVAFALLGYRRPRSDRDWMLLLWLGACAAVYFLVPEFPPHALAGVTLPLAVLAVGGWERLRAATGLPPRVAALGAAAAVAAVTVPVVVYDAQGVHRDFSGTVAGALSEQLVRVTDDQAAALAYLARSPRPGGVLSSWLLSFSVPEFTGRQTFAGHLQWQPKANLALDGTFFDPGLKDPHGVLRRAILARSRASFVLANCGSPVTLAADLAPVARAVRRFGCVTVYETR
jgi:hypothetical protein